MSSNDAFIKSLLTEAGRVSSDFVEDIRHKGFDLGKIIAMAQALGLKNDDLLRMAIVGALRGNKPDNAVAIKMNGGISLDAMLSKLEADGKFFPRSMIGQGKGPGGKLTLVRLSYAFAEAVAIALRNHKSLPRRFSMTRLRPHLQFMGAGSLQLPPKVRAEHKLFAREFSAALRDGKVDGARFNGTLYAAGETNAVAVRMLDLSDRAALDNSFSRASEDAEALGRGLNID